MFKPFQCIKSKASLAKFSHQNDIKTESSRSILLLNIFTKKYKTSSLILRNNAFWAHKDNLRAAKIASY